MTKQQRIDPERELSHELLCLACGDAGEPSATLRARLDESAKLREQLEETTELLTTLRSALSPDPFPAHVEARIHAALDELPVARRTWRWPLHVIGSAAAACLLAALLLPWRGGPVSDNGLPSGSRFDLTEADAAAIVAAHWDMGSDTLADYSVGVLEQHLETTARRLERDPTAESVLPWGPEDDWDMPAATLQRSDANGASWCGMPTHRTLSLDGVPT